jgi:hypothetical protein
LRGKSLIILFFLMIFAIEGCAPKTQELSPLAPISDSFESELANKSQSFKDGFWDGCQSARGEFKKDEDRFLSDGDYNDGWYEGNSKCKLTTQ